MPDWLSVASLVIAVLGGVPGALTAWKAWRAKPRLVVTLVNLVTGRPAGPNEVDGGAMLLLAVTVSNAGHTPFTPVRYQCAMRKNGKWVELDASLVPPGMTLHADNTRISPEVDVGVVVLRQGRPESGVHDLRPQYRRVGAGGEECVDLQGGRCGDGVSGAR